MYSEKRDQELVVKVPQEIEESGQSSGFVQQPEQYVGVPVIPMTAVVIQPILPRSLWPHNFLIFSLIMTVVLGVLNQITLALTIPATILAFLVSRN